MCIFSYFNFISYILLCVATQTRPMPYYEHKPLTHNMNNRQDFKDDMQLRISKMLQQPLSSHYMIQMEVEEVNETVASRSKYKLDKSSTNDNFQGFVAVFL